MGSDIERAEHAYDVLWNHLVVHDELRPVDAALCFGSLDASVPARAAALFHRGFASVIVVSGAAPRQGARTEAEAFASRLVELDVPQGSIVQEARARHTGENVALGIAALEDRMGSVGSVVTVSWPFAARRCAATLARQHPSLEVVRAPALPAGSSAGRPAWSLTVRTAAAAVRECAKLERYRTRDLLVDAPPPAGVQEAVAVLRAWLGGRQLVPSETLVRS